MTRTNREVYQLSFPPIIWILAGSLRGSSIEKCTRKRARACVTTTRRECARKRDDARHKAATRVARDSARCLRQRALCATTRHNPRVTRDNGDARHARQCGLRATVRATRVNARDKARQRALHATARVTRNDAHYARQRA